MRLEIMGPPGAGKGTQARQLADWLGIPHISTGDMFRDGIRRGTELGQAAGRHLERGELVPDEVVSGMVRERLLGADCRAGYVLDGYPRTVRQVKELDRMLEEQGWARTAVLSLRVPEEEIVRRLAGRRSCASCGAVTRGASVDRCGRCGGPLAERADDREDVVRERLRVYAGQTAPLLELYRGRGLLVEVDGCGDEAEVERRIRAALARVAA